MHSDIDGIAGPRVKYDIVGMVVRLDLPLRLQAQRCADVVRVWQDGIAADSHLGNEAGREYVALLYHLAVSVACVWMDCYLLSS